MILYHGSSSIIDVPVYARGSLHNDYGRGFYCTESLELAKEWACPGKKDGFSNVYDFDAGGLTLINLNSGEYSILNWLALLLKNRVFSIRSAVASQAFDYILDVFLPDISSADVIQGYRADDSYFAFANDFLNNMISLGQLKQAMVLGDLGEQIVLVSPKAFERISFMRYETADSSIYHVKRSEREDRARNTYLNEHGRDFVLSEKDIFVRDIVIQEMKENGQ